MIGDEGVEGAAGEMRVLALDGQHDQVLARAEEWFGRAARGEALTEWGWPRYTPEFVGSAVEEPPLLLILLPVATALGETGRCDAALEIARMIPDLVDQSIYRGWGPIGETARWERLVERCAGGELEPRRLSYEEAITDVARLLGAV